MAKVMSMNELLITCKLSTDLKSYSGVERWEEPSAAGSDALCDRGTQHRGKPGSHRPPRQLLHPDRALQEAVFLLLVADVGEAETNWYHRVVKTLQSRKSIIKVSGCQNLK